LVERGRRGGGKLVSVGSKLGVLSWSCVSSACVVLVMVQVPKSSESFCCSSSISPQVGSESDLIFKIRGPVCVSFNLSLSGVLPGLSCPLSTWSATVFRLFSVCLVLGMAPSSCDASLLMLVFVSGSTCRSCGEEKLREGAGLETKTGGPTEIWGDNGQNLVVISKSVRRLRQMTGSLLVEAMSNILCKNWSRTEVYSDGCKFSSIGSRRADCHFLFIARA